MKPKNFAKAKLLIMLVLYIKYPFLNQKNKIFGMFQILLVVADVCKSDDRKKIVDETVKKFGQINVLVNNAGIYIQCPFENITEDDYDKTMATNVKQAVFLSQLCLPYLIAQKG